MYIFVLKKFFISTIAKCHRVLSLSFLLLLSFLFIFVKEEKKGYWRLGGKERNDSCGNDVESEARRSFQRQLHRCTTHIGWRAATCWRAFEQRDKDVTLLWIVKDRGLFFLRARRIETHKPLSYPSLEQMPDAYKCANRALVSPQNIR